MLIIFLSTDYTDSTVWLSSPQGYLCNQCNHVDHLANEITQRALFFRLAAGGRKDLASLQFNGYETV